MGQRDLKQMREGVKDPRGQGQTQGGWICAIVGTILSGLGVLVMIFLIVFYVIMIVSMMSAMRAMPVSTNPAKSAPAPGNPAPGNPGPGNPPKLLFEGGLLGR
jgi:hypothetical protein